MRTRLRQILTALTRRSDWILLLLAAGSVIAVLATTTGTLPGAAPA